MFVICLRIKDSREVQPLAWCKTEPSNRVLKRAVKKFLKDADVDGGVAMGWERLYNSKTEMKSELPEYA